MSENLEKTYNPKAIEAKLYEKWCETNISTPKQTEEETKIGRAHV